MIMTSDLVRELGEIWTTELNEVRQRIASRFARRETRTQAVAYIEGQLAGIESPNGWTLAMQAGDRRPDRMQRLLYSARWDDAAVRADLRDYVVDRLGDPAAVLSLGETAVAKQGAMTVGVDRQPAKASGRTENCQVSVHLAYVSSRGRALIDGELYLPEGSWTRDAARRAAAGVPPDRGYAGRPDLAARMLRRALGAHTPAAWVVGDEDYGASAALRQVLEDHPIGYVLGIRPDHPVLRGGRATRAAELVAALSRRSFDLRVADVDRKLPRYVTWAWLRLDGEPAPGWSRFLLVRRSARHLGAPRERAGQGLPALDRYFLCAAPSGTTLGELIQVTETGSGAMECLAVLRADTGFDRHQVRLWHAWYRHATLCMVAAACLAVCRATVPQRTVEASCPGRPLCSSSLSL